MSKHHDFSKRLDELLINYGYSQRKIAFLLGISPSALSLYRSGKRTPSIDTIKKIANLFGVSVSYLLGETNDPTPEKKPEVKLGPMKKPVKMVPVFSTSVSAGSGAFPDAFYPIDTVPIDRPDVKYAFKVEGKSMEPIIQDGSIVYVAPDPDPGNGEIVVCIYDGFFYVKYFYREKDRILLISENPEYVDIIVDPNERFEIIGVVVEIRHTPRRKKIKKG